MPPSTVGTCLFAPDKEYVLQVLYEAHDHCLTKATQLEAEASAAQNRLHRIANGVEAAPGHAQWKDLKESVVLFQHRASDLRQRAKNLDLFADKVHDTPTC